MDLSDLFRTISFFSALIKQITPKIINEVPINKNWKKSSVVLNLTSKKIPTKIENKPAIIKKILVFLLVKII